MVGLIIGSSSITGALFDFAICRIFKNTDFRRVFLTMFAICLIYPLLLWQSKTLWLFLLAMAIWGIYYDLHGFGIFDFIGRHTEKKDHSSNFGIIQIFQSLGVILAPLIVGFVIVDAIDWRAFSLGWIFLIVSFTFFLTLLIFMRKHRPTDGNLAYPPRRKNFFTELHLWKKLGKLLTPVLLLTFYLFFIDAFFWTLAPLYAEASSLGEFGGLFLTAYALPALIVGWFVGSLTKRFGKKRTAFVGLLLGSLILSSFSYLPNPILSIVIVFVASLFISMSMPAINAAYADYISEATQVEGEIEGLEDFAFNIGYVLGPISAGVLADTLGMKGAFSILGLLGVILAVILLVVTPKTITIKTRPSEL
jgi:MFS family permease